MMTFIPPLPKELNFVELLEKLREISWGASDILMAYARGTQPPHGFSSSLNVINFSDGPVTAADLSVNSWVLENLENSYPNVSWQYLSEETAKDKLNDGVPINSDWLWILDPLDGTKDFLVGNGEYAMHLALVYKNRPILGIVLIPELEELWIGALGMGTWCEGRDAIKKTFAFSQRKELKDLVLVASRNHRNDILEELIKSLKVSSSKSVGSIGCKIAMILRGEADFYISLSGTSSPKDWDLAAPEILLISAGGRLTKHTNQQLLYNTGDVNQRGCLVACHGISHDCLLDNIQLFMK